MSDTLETTPHGATDAEHDAHGPAGHHGYIGDRQRYLNRLKRIEGQARGIRLWQLAVRRHGRSGRRQRTPV